MGSTPTFSPRWNAMADPIRNLLGWLEPRDSPHLTSPEHELIERRDRVEYAASLIRSQELRVWFEQNWRDARQIALLCPECLVFSLPPEAVLLDELNLPPPWRRRRRPEGIL